MNFMSFVNEDQYKHYYCYCTFVLRYFNPAVGGMTVFGQVYILQQLIFLYHRKLTISVMVCRSQWTKNILLQTQPFCKQKIVHEQNIALSYDQPKQKYLRNCIGRTLCSSKDKVNLRPMKSETDVCLEGTVPRDLKKKTDIFILDPIFSEEKQCEPIY